MIAASFDWRDPNPSSEDLARLLSALPGRGADDGVRAFRRAPHALLGHAGRGVQPFHDVERQIFAVADLRIDNRADLRAALGSAGRAGGSDVALLVAAFARWGPRVVEHLVGDFAFVIWDARRREVHAARDPFGVRPLVYRSSTGRIVFASSPTQLLALPDTDRTPNPEVVVNYLSANWSSYGPTFFRSIHSVRPGHYVCANEAGCNEVEYFRPSELQVRHGRPEDYEEHFRSLFEQAVRDRLDGSHPILAHLSGGLDSSSIVCMADRIYGRGDTALPPFHVGSALYPGQPHDETTHIDVVTRHIRFASHRWDGNLPSGREFSHPSLAVPGGSVTANSGSTGDLDTAHAIGARVVLCGDPGDFVTGEVGLFNELLVRGRWLTLARQIAAGGSARERAIRLTLLRRAVHDEAPLPLLRLWRARHLYQPTIPPPPAWLRSHLARMWDDPLFGNPPLDARVANRLQRKIWSYLRWSRVAWAVEVLSASAADRGIEMRFPFLDARLVRFMLAIPYQQRLLGPTRRSFHRRAMSGILPDEIVRRPSKAVFNRAVVNWGHTHIGIIRDVLSGSPWRSGDFVDQRAARTLLDELAARAPDAADRKGWIYMRAIVNLETWLRAVFLYAFAQEILPMREITTKSETPSGEQQGSEVQAPLYDAPRLTPVGNVRALLAGGQFTGDDNTGGGNQTADQPGG